MPGCVEDASEIADPSRLIAAIAPQYTSPTPLAPLPSVCDCDSPYIALNQGSMTISASQVVLSQKTAGS